MPNSVADFGSRLTPPVWLPHQHLAEPARLSLLCESRAGYQNLCGAAIAPVEMTCGFDATVFCAAAGGRIAEVGQAR